MSKNTWHYAPLRLYSDAYDDEVWQVCEMHGKRGHTGGLSPRGESLEELENDLMMMLEDVRKCIRDGRQIDECTDMHTGALVK